MYGRPVGKVIHNFGRSGKVHRQALARLVASISRFLDPERAVAAAGAKVEVTGLAGDLGGGWVLGGCGTAWRSPWRSARLRRAGGLRGDHRAGDLRAGGHRAVEPPPSWPPPGGVAERAAAGGVRVSARLPAYAAMDFLLDALAGSLPIFSSVGHLLNPGLNIVFVDTSSACWEGSVADELASWPDRPHMTRNVRRRTPRGRSGLPGPPR